MEIKKRWLAGLIVVPLALAGCTGTPTEPSTDVSKASGEKVTIAVVTHGSPGDTFWDVVKSGAEQAGEDLGATITYQGDGSTGLNLGFVEPVAGAFVDVHPSEACVSGPSAHLKRSLR